MISEIDWNYLYFVQCMDDESFGGLCNDISEKWKTWSEWIMCENPHTDKLPEQWEDKLTRFEKLLILKAFRPEKLLFAFTNYVLSEIG